MTPTFQVLTGLGAAGLLICIISLIELHILPTGFNPINDPVSNYAVSRYGYLYGIQAFASGICGACLLALFAISGAALPIWGIAALVCYSLSRLLIGFFPMDVKPPRTRPGTIHLVLAALTFAGIAIAAATLTSPLTGLATWSKVGAQLNAAASLTELAAVAFLVVLVVNPLRQLVGFVERCIYLGTFLWLGNVFVQLLLSLR